MLILPFFGRPFRTLAMTSISKTWKPFMTRRTSSCCRTCGAARSALRAGVTTRLAVLLREIDHRASGWSLLTPLLRTKSPGLMS